MFDVEGFATGFGNPAWLERRGAAAEVKATAPAVAALASAGAVLVGKTHMDELAYSLNGENEHYGTPLNPAAPERVPGACRTAAASHFQRLSNDTPACVCDEFIFLCFNF